MWKKAFLFTIIFAATILFSGCIDQLDKRRLAGLQVSTNDVPSALYLDGEFLADTPFNKKDLQPGRYTLRIVPDDNSYAPSEMNVTLTSGLLTAVIWTPGKTADTSGGVLFELQKIANRQQAELTVSSIPDGAIVHINNGELEFTPLLRTELTAGKHDISISLPSYVEQLHTLNLVAGYRLSVQVTLAKTTADIEPSTNSTLDTDQDADQDSNQDAEQNTQQSTNQDLDTNNPQPIRTARPQATQQDQQTTQTITITSTGFFENDQEVLRVRSGAGSGFSQVGLAPVGSTYPYLNENTAGWFKIQFTDTTVGWVSQSYAELK